MELIVAHGRENLNWAQRTRGAYDAWNDRGAGKGKFEASGEESWKIARENGVIAQRSGCGNAGRGRGGYLMVPERDGRGIEGSPLVCEGMVS